MNAVFAALVLTASAPVHLAQLLQEARARNPQIEAARLRAKAAEARVSPAGALDDPMLELQLWNAPVDFSTVPLMLELSQPVPLGGKRADRADAASAAARAAQAAAAEQEQDVEQAVKKAYFDLFVAERSEQVDAELREVVRALRKSALSQLESGRGEASEPLRLQSEDLALQADIAVNQRQAASARIRLAALLDRDPSAPLGPTGTPALLSSLPTLAELRARALRQRPELARAQAMVDQAEAERALAKAEKVPDLGLSIGEMHSFGMPGTKDFLFAGVKVNLPIFGGSKNGPRIAAAIDEREAARAKARAVTDRITAELADDEASVRSEEQIIHLHHALVPLSRQALQSAEASYAAGRARFSDVLDALRELRRHELELAMHLANYERALADLERAVGGDLGLVEAAEKGSPDEHP